MPINRIEPPPNKIDTFTFHWRNWLHQLYLMVKALYASRTQIITISNDALSRGSTPPTQITIGNYNGWSFAIGTDSVFTIELGNDIDDSKAIGIHFSFVINEAYALGSAEVRWQAVYACTPQTGEAINAPTHTGTLTTADINIPATAYHVYHSATLEIPAGSYASGDVIGIKFSRIALTAGANPVAVPAILSMHLEYTAQTIDWFSE